MQSSGFLTFCYGPTLPRSSGSTYARSRRPASHLLGILNDILDFSKMEAGKLSIETRVFDVDMLLAHIAEQLHERATGKGLELEFDVARDVPRRLVGDPLRITQVLVNLGDNGIKFTATEDQLCVADVVPRRIRRHAALFRP